jgi:hypothetical protein
MLHDFNLSHPDFQHLPIFFTESALIQFDDDDTRYHYDDYISHYFCTKGHYLKVYEEMNDVFCVKEVQIVDFRI